MDWKAIILSAVRNDPFFLILVITAGLLLLVQGILVILNLRKSASAAAAGWSIVLAPVTPLLVIFVLIMDVQFSHIAPLYSVATPPALGEYLVFLTSAMGEVIILRAVYGLMLMAAALVGILGAASARKLSAPTGKIAALGVCLAAAAAAAGVLMHTINLGYGLGQFNYPDNAERSIYMKQLLEEIPGYTFPLILVFIILFAAACLGFIKSLKKGGSTPALVAGGLAFLIGAGAFVATRNHRDDVKKLPELFEKLRQKREILFDHPETRLVNLKNVDVIEQAPVIVVNRNQVVLEGYVTMVSGLLERLELIKKNFGQLYPETKFPGRIILQADRETPGLVIRKVLGTCREIGYVLVQLATQQPDVLQTSVLGELRPVRYMGLTFTITDQEEEGLALNDDETLGQLAKRLDQAAANPPVKIRL